MAHPAAQYGQLRGRRGQENRNDCRISAALNVNSWLRAHLFIDHCPRVSTAELAVALYLLIIIT